MTDNAAEAAAAPVLDANGTPVPAPPGIPTDVFRQFMAGRVPALCCPHYLAKSEADAGFTRCEHCPRWVTDEFGMDVDLDAFNTLAQLRAALPGQRWVTGESGRDIDLDAVESLTQLRILLAG